jgi:carbon-monoxide dehydrogenase medium subunit
MKAAPFDYIVATTVAEASAALAEPERSASLIAGGQSLLPLLNLRVAQPDLLIDISRITELKDTRTAPDAIHVGALTTHADVEDGRIPDPFGGLLRKVASGISYRAIRNYGTIGGSVALADPAADWPICLIALGAKVNLGSTKAARALPVDDFIEGQYATALGKDEIILGFEIPCPAGRLRFGLQKVVRKSGAFADSMAMAVEHADGTIAVALGGAVARPFLLTAFGERVRAGEATEDGLRAAIAQDLKIGAPQADSYLMRLHTATALRALAQMRAR